LSANGEKENYKRVDEETPFLLFNPCHGYSSKKVQTQAQLFYFVLASADLTHYTYLLPENFFWHACMPATL
jgi:hypothetical protein